MRIIFDWLSNNVRFISKLSSIMDETCSIEIFSRIIEVTILEKRSLGTENAWEISGSSTEMISSHSLRM